jgi:hypothetical protein
MWLTAQSQKAWTPEEEAVFIAVFDRMVKDHLWTYAKEEEAIAHRGSTGVRAHWTAMVSSACNQALLQARRFVTDG